MGYHGWDQRPSRLDDSKDHLNQVVLSLAGVGRANVHIGSKRRMCCIGRATDTQILPSGWRVGGWQG